MAQGVIISLGPVGRRSQFNQEREASYCVIVNSYAYATEKPHAAINFLTFSSAITRSSNAIATLFAG